MLLEKEGAKVHIAQNDMKQAPDGIFGVIHLASLFRDNTFDASKDTFSLMKRAVRNGVSVVMAATGLGGKFGAQTSPDAPMPIGGIGGLMKTLAWEKPEALV